MRDTDIREFFAGIGREVLHPNYNNGRWRVHFRGEWKSCSNQSTATAWAMYFRRRCQDGWTAYISKEQHR